MRFFNWFTREKGEVVYTLTINSFVNGVICNETHYFNDEWIARHCFGIRAQNMNVFDMYLVDSNNIVYGKLQRDKVTANGSTDKV